MTTPGVSLTVTARPPSPWRRLRGAAKRHRRLTALFAGLLFLAGVIAAVATSRAAERRRQEEQQARIERVEDLGRQMSIWDASLYKRPRDVHFPHLLAEMERISAEREHLVDDDPHSANAHYHLARARERLGKTDEALRDLDHAVRLRPGEGAYLLERGLLRLRLGTLERFWSVMTLRFPRAGTPEDLATGMVIRLDASLAPPVWRAGAPPLAPTPAGLPAGLRRWRRGRR
ncbi:MAG: tetratricopeptide repeat protein [Planctomycetes bacterium]|nr:tetratricopeptide repeat protein [Planctomycetota bacterium]